MAAVLAGNGSFQAFDDSSQPPTQTSSPSSPTCSIYSQPRSTNGSSSLEPPPDMSFADYLRTWDDSLVARWLSDVKCGHLASTFSANDIRGDVLLELDQVTLKEMGMASVGDRLRVLNGVKSLRQRCSSTNAALVSIMNRPRISEPIRSNSSNGDIGSFPGRTQGHRRLDSGRPAPLHLAPPGGSPDPNLPRIIRDGSESGSTQPATSSTSARHTNGIRPLPQQPGSGSSAHSTPTTSHSVRANLPPLPPPPRGQPPLPPNPRTPHTLQPPPSAITGRRTPIQSESSPYSPHTNNLLTPTSGSQGARTPLRSQSPQLPFPSMSQSNRGNVQNNAHNRSGSLNNPPPAPPVKLPPRPSTGNNSHPYAQSGPQAALSPIAESFISRSGNGSSGTPSPPTGPYNRNGIAGPLRPGTPQNNASHSAPSLDDLRRRLVKISLPNESKSATINVADCAGGVEVLIKALKKFNKLGSRGESEGGAERVETQDGGLSVEGWGVYLNGLEDASGSPLTEAQLLSICHAPPDDPSRENGLTLRLIGRKGSTPRSGSPAVGVYGSEEDLLNPGRVSMSTKATKRASSISILSGLGVPNPEKALETAASTSSLSQSPTKTPNSGRRPAHKLRNFFGQRPPSELITTHLPEYFPNADKKVLERTRRQSMMRAGLPYKRDSVASWNAPPQSRFSVSTLGSQRGSARLSVASASPMIPDRSQSPPPPMPPASETKDRHLPPRLSLSTDDGSSIDLETDDSYKRLSSPHILPPVAFPSESLSESLNLETNQSENRRQSRTLSSLSTASKRMSYITELRSKRDRSDTASLMTVDEITASVESRRESTVQPDSGSDEWTQVDAEDDEKRSIMEEEEEEEEEDTEEEDDDDDDTLENEADLSDEEETGKTTVSAGRERTIKWIKGALIGAGSFGKVYLGMDASTGLLMAVKQVELPTGSAPNEERKKSMLSALEREIELLQELQHENIVQYLSSCIDDDHLNIFLEYVPGGSVTSLLRNYGAFEEPLVRNWVRQILLGLNYLHERDIIHRDIKGANMLVDNKGGIKISDFGISKKVEDNLHPGNRAHRPSLQGSVFWMAPEVVKQTAYTRKADIWSVGCLVVEMLTGEHPWAQLTQMQAIFKIGSSAKPAIPADISPEADNFLQLTFELNHEARPSAAELLKHPWIANQPMPLSH
ncbi:Pkinase-domain-containing protein [Daedalea quercina L-15889]|uniref:mitogen-activated protein kinase kinase kinase n=1 Tax=Daedalea quercina L-15889 TaxID=1314783 RepID=A0A165P4D0_9APHY|nr:Pkinase-domain-containing protein [Daedalea quercina L-15889]